MWRNYVQSLIQVSVSAWFAVPQTALNGPRHSCLFCVLYLDALDGLLMLIPFPLFSFFVLGSDFNLQESDFSELDPHAVASIFKAYLRERKLSYLHLSRPPLHHFSLSFFLPPYSPPQEEFTLKRVFFISHYSSPATLDVSINPTVRSGNECRSQRSTSCQTGRFRGP